jgi:PAB-dependent poly(A)-specific ribonuclease subunit 2
VKNPISQEMMFTNASLVTPRRKHITFVPLDKEELPQRGDVVGLDTEFVTLNQEESEVHSDGTMSMIKPSQMCVARVTCIRGSVILTIRHCLLQ